MPRELDRYDRDDLKPVTCSVCGNQTSVYLRCQGAAPDFCCAPICFNCEEDQRCDGCKLPACPSHLKTHPDCRDERWCETCLLKERSNIGDTTAEMTEADRVECPF